MIFSNLKSRDLVCTGVPATAVWYLNGSRVAIEYPDIDPRWRELPKNWRMKPSRWQISGKPVVTSNGSKNLRADLGKSKSPDEEGIEKAKIQHFLEFEWPSGWRWKRVGTIRLASSFPLLVLILWLTILFTMQPQVLLSEQETYQYENCNPFRHS